MSTRLSLLFSFYLKPGLRTHINIDRERILDTYLKNNFSNKKIGGGGGLFKSSLIYGDKIEHLQKT